MGVQNPAQSFNPSQPISFESGLTRPQTIMDKGHDTLEVGPIGLFFVLPVPSQIDDKTMLCYY